MAAAANTLAIHSKAEHHHCVLLTSVCVYEDAERCRTLRFCRPEIAQEDRAVCIDLTRCYLKFPGTGCRNRSTFFGAISIPTFFPIFFLLCFCSHAAIQSIPTLSGFLDSVDPERRMQIWGSVSSIIASLMPHTCFYIESGQSQGSSSNSLADFLFSGSHWSIFCTKSRNSSLSFPSREDTESLMLKASGIRSLCIKSPGINDQRYLCLMAHVFAEILPSESKKGPR